MIICCYFLDDLCNGVVVSVDSSIGRTVLLIRNNVLKVKQ